MAQSHVLMMLATAATSFLEGESDRTETGPATFTGIDPDRRRVKPDASIYRTGVKKTPVVTGAANKLAIENAG
ncbi:MAG: hypothetical protein ABWZ29_00125 [Casimicrobiaceae bacterium]